MEARSFKRWNATPVQDLLPPESMRRTPARRAARLDIVDAEFVVLGGETPREAPAKGSNDNGRTASPPAGLRYNEPATLAVRTAEQFLQRASLISFFGLVVSLAILVFGLSGGFAAFSQPRSAGLPTPLHFTHVTAMPRDANGMSILLINGIVENQGQTTQVLQPIRADIMSGTTLAASVVIDPPAEVLYAGQSLGFSTKIRYSGARSPDIRLSFMQ